MIVAVFFRGNVLMLKSCWKLLKYNSLIFDVIQAGKLWEVNFWVNMSNCLVETSDIWSAKNHAMFEMPWNLLLISLDFFLYLYHCFFTSVGARLVDSFLINQLKFNRTWMTVKEFFFKLNRNVFGFSYCVNKIVLTIMPSEPALW